MELFLHPWFMVAGGALISSPIIIHLINRMRFKRVRWAAMEFLLKSQKRNRRRLIIEQIILLLLRILLVLLVAFLLARFVGNALGSTGSGTMHVFVLDDTLSMADRWGDAGETRTALNVGKDQIKQIAKMAALANSAQHIQVYRLSDLGSPLYNKRIDDRTEEDLTRILDGVKPTMLHIDPIKAVNKAREVLNGVPQSQRFLHLVSDFRDTDWGTGANLEEVNGQVGKLLEAGISLSMVDTAHPFRNETKGFELNHDNLAIVDFKAESRMAAEGVPMEFTVVIHNYGSKDEKNFLTIYKDGVKDFTASVPLDTLPAGQQTEQKFTLLFEKKKPTPEFVHVSAEINREETGLQADNVRDLVIEVRKKIPALIVDGAGRESQKPGGDSYHLSAFLSGPAFEAEFKTLEELATLNLDTYPSIYLVNVPQIKNKELLDKLEKYVRNGGSLAYFLGDKVVSTFYNETLHKEYKGLFPVKIAGRYTDPLTPEEREFRMQRDPTQKILFRDDKHPIVSEWLATKGKGVFRYLLIERYWPTLPKSQWIPEDPKEPVQEAITLPNRNSIDAYKLRAQELGKQAADLTAELAAADPTFEKYIPVMAGYKRQILEALGTELLHNLERVLDRLLDSPGEVNNPARPNMRDLWAQPLMKALEKQIRDFKETVLYGDPLLLTRAYGKGRVAVCLTTAGTASKWNEWGSGTVSFTYPIFIKDLQRYLTSESAGLNRVVTAEAGIKLEFDADKFREEVELKMQPQPDLEDRKAGDNPDVRPEVITSQKTMTEETRKTLSGEERKVRVFSFDDARRPGVYTFEFKPIDANQPSEFHSYAFNVDAAAESNLKRASKEKLDVKIKSKDSRAGKVRILSPGDPLIDFKAREPDASETPWLYLLFLIVLIVEQALAVHLSFHLKPNEQAAAPARPQPAAA